MSNDREFRVKIKTEADTAGIKLFGGHMGELTKTARELQREFPQVAAVLRLLTGPAGVVFLAAEAFIKAKEALAEWNKELDDAAEKLAEPTFEAGINAKKKALEDAQTAFEVYLQKLNAGIDAEQAFTEGVERSAAVMKAAAEVHKSLGDAAFGLDEAKLKASLDAGLVDQQTYFQKLTELEIKHAQDERQRHEQEQDDELKFKQQTLAGRQARQGGLEAAAKGATSAGADARSRAERDAADLPALKAESDRLAGIALKAQEELARVQSLIRSGVVDPGYDARYLTKAGDAATAAENGRRAYQSVFDRVAGEQKTATLSEADATRAQATAQRNAEATEKLAAEIETLNLTISVNRPGERAAGVTGDLATLLSKNPEAARLFTIALSQGRLDKGQPISGQESANIGELNSFMSVNHSNSALILKFMRDIVAHQTDSGRVVQDIQRQLDLLKGQPTNQSRNSPP